jgi:hypothetical protein
MEQEQCPLCRGGKYAYAVDIVMEHTGFDRQKAMGLVVETAIVALSNPVAIKYLVSTIQVKAAKRELFAEMWNQAVSERGGEE